jgi:hypothetical protein
MLADLQHDSGTLNWDSIRHENATKARSTAPSKLSVRLRSKGRCSGGLRSRVDRKDQCTRRPCGRSLVLAPDCFDRAPSGVVVVTNRRSRRHTAEVWCRASSTHPFLSADRRNVFLGLDADCDWRACRGNDGRRNVGRRGYAPSGRSRHSSPCRSGGDSGRCFGMAGRDRVDLCVPLRSNGERRLVLYWVGTHVACALCAPAWRLANMVYRCPSCRSLLV